VKRLLTGGKAGVDSLLRLLWAAGSRKENTPLEVRKERRERKADTLSGLGPLFTQGGPA